MDKTDIKHALERIAPNEAIRQEMLYKMKLTAREQGKGQRNRSLSGTVRWLALASVLVVLGFFVFVSLYDKADSDLSVPEGMTSSSDSTDIAVVTGQFLFEGKNYCKVLENGTLPQTVPASDIGEEIGKIEQSSDADLVGGTVYEYRPLGCEAVVAVLRDSVYELFTFSYFQSYHDNADEDAKEYLKLYGISGPQDIVKLEVYRYPDAYSQECVVQITDAEQISQFYGYYSQLTESSEAYFNVLSQGPEAPPAGDNSNSVASWAGTAGDKLSNSRTVVIYAANGLSFSTEYYPNIQFLSRYAVDDAFAQWLQELAFS